MGVWPVTAAVLLGALSCCSCSDCGKPAPPTVVQQYVGAYAGDKFIYISSTCLDQSLDTCEYTSVAKAVASLRVGEEATLVFVNDDLYSNGYTEYIFDSPYIIPANVTLRLERGARLSIQDTVTIAGQLDAGKVQIFSGPGSVSFGTGVIEVYPEWWGAVANHNPWGQDGVDCKNAIDRALLAHSRVRFGAGYYRYHGKMTLNQSYSYKGLYGVNRDKTRIYFTNSLVSAAIEATGCTNEEVWLHDFEFKDIGLFGNGPGGGSVTGVYIAKNAPNCTAYWPGSINFHDVQIAEFPGMGIFIPELWDSTISRLMMRDIGGHGLVVGGAPTLVLENIDWIHNTGGSCIWLLQGRPVLDAVNVGECPTGIKVGRMSGELPAPYDNATVCQPLMNDINVEPTTHTGLYFSSGSYPSVMHGVTVYSAESTVVEYGVYFHWLGGYVNASKIVFSNKAGGSYNKKIYVNGGENTGAAIYYYGPPADISSGGQGNKFIVSMLGEKKPSIPGLTINSYLTLPSVNGNVGTISWSTPTVILFVANTSVTANSSISFEATNQNAANLLGGVQHPYIFSLAAGSGFTIATGDGNIKAGGTATFNYVVFN